MADFTGFYFDDIHSSTYHILRVSDGDRYKEGLFPEFEDRAVELVGGDGSIYEGTDYKQTEFTINIAFDSITEQDFKDIKKWLQPNKIKSFRFDERPYKAYWAKLRTRPVFEYVCFLEENRDGFLGTKERVYKGEATLEFIAYDPFGYCFDNSTQISQKGLREADGINWQALDSYSSFAILDNNVDEWGLTSGLKNKSQLQDYNKFTTIQQEDNTDYIAKLYNPGDFDVDFELFFGIEFPPLETEKLELELSDSEDYYIITRIASDVSGEIVLPATYNNLPIKSIKNEACNGNTGITAIVVPDSIQSIGEKAFFGCVLLERVVIGQGIRSIGQNAFGNCPKLKTFICLALKAPNIDAPIVGTGGGDKTELFVPSALIPSYKDKWVSAGFAGISGYVSSVTGLSETLPAVHVTLEITDETENSQFFVFSLENLKNTDSIFLNSKKHSLTVFHYGTAEELRYDLVKSTHWPKIPIGESTIKVTSRAPLENLQIKYGYKYY